jgi:hypothetical protein
MAVPDLPETLIAAGSIYGCDTSFPTGPLPLQQSAVKRSAPIYEPTSSRHGARRDVHYQAKSTDVAQYLEDTGTKIACLIMSLWGTTFMQLANCLT